MITSKPKFNTVFSLSMFLIICFSLIGYTLYNYLHYVNHSWYQYAIFIIITPIAVIVTLKTIQSFKVLQLGKGKLKIHYPLLFKRKIYEMKDLKGWEEATIKTYGSVFKALTLEFDVTKINIASQENDEYQKILSYLKRKHLRKKRN